jgi:site-specific recombinase
MAILDYLIPGYKGYRLRDESRQTDKLFRDYITQQLTAEHQKLENIKVDLTRTGNLSALNPADACTKQLTKVRDKLRFANYGFSALFEKGQRKVDHTRLERIEQFDKELVDKKDEVVKQIDQIQSVLDGGGEVAAEFRKLTGALRTMEQHMQTREQMIRGNE